MRQTMVCKLVAITLFTLVSVCDVRVAPAAQLDLTDVPLFLTLNVIPNIFYLIDDSASMDLEVMTKDPDTGAFTNSQPDGTSRVDDGGVKHLDADGDGLPDCSFPSADAEFGGYVYGVQFPNNTFKGTPGGQNCNLADDRAWRFRNSDFNALYFDPNRVYKPWVGVDKNGNPFKEYPITAALDNPSPNVVSVKTIDLTRDSVFGSGITRDHDGDGAPDGFRYYTWTDLDGDGNFDNGEETEFLIKNADAATQQNFSNWFTYSRKRSYATKKVFGEIVDEVEGVRMGMATFNTASTSHTAICDVPFPDPPPNPISEQHCYTPTFGTNDPKRQLMTNLYSVAVQGNKTLRTPLNNTGQYFMCQGGFFKNEQDAGHCPLLPPDEGGKCQQNFVLLMTDGPYDGVYSGTGNEDINGPGDFDGGAHADSWSDTAGDIAMYYYETDLDGISTNNNVPTVPGIDENSQQHIVTMAISFGATGSLNADPPNRTDPFAWPDPNPKGKGKPASVNSPRIDDLRHAAFNSRGKFINATRPERLKQVIVEAMEAIADRTSSAASVALNSGSRNANSRIYQARFKSGRWSGQLFSFPLTTTGKTGTPEWDSSLVLDGQNWDTGRNIWTYKSDSRVGVPFRWGNLSTAQRDQLNINIDGVNDGRGQDRLEFLRGKRDLEGTTFRDRTTVLGDLIDSDPFFVGEPGLPDSVGSGYNNFRSTTSRPDIVYVGGNDGMLHGFNANDGSEVLAYVPNEVYGNLSRLTSKDYKHRFFVDGSPTVGDVNLTGTTWQSVLVGSLRQGGQGVFALNVTEPQNFTASDVLWEFTDADDADLGYTYGQASIVRMQNGRWAAVFGNGYNNTEPDGAASTTGTAALYIVFLDGGLDGTWTPGDDYIKIEVGCSPCDPPNGLATPAAVDVEGDFTADYIYAGDLRGNMYRFDVSSPNPTGWKMGAIVYSSTTGNKLDASAAPIRLPITSRPQVGAHPKSKCGQIVYFGTGKFIETSDNSNPKSHNQEFLAVWDQPPTQCTLEPIVVTPPVSKANLVKQKIEVSARGRIVVPKAVDWGETATVKEYGWSLPLPLDGERVVTNPLLRNERIIFTTLIPDTRICSFGGTSWLMEVDAFTGGSLKEPAFDLDEDGLFTDEDKDPNPSSNTSGELVSLAGLESTEGILPSPTVLAAGATEIKFNSGSKGGIFVTVENPGPRASGRIAWRQFD